MIAFTMAVHLVSDGRQRKRLTCMLLSISGVVPLGATPFFYHAIMLGFE